MRSVLSMLLWMACAPAPSVEPVAPPQGEGTRLVRLGFVGTAEDLRVAELWWDELRRDPGTIVGGAPEHFEPLFAEQEQIVEACEHPSGLCIDVDALAAVEASFGAADHWIAFTDDPLFAASSPEGIIISRLYAAPVLDHELGHALVGLADEYSVPGGHFADEDHAMAGAWTTEPYPELDVLNRTPNLTIDPMGSKWAPYDGVPVEGGKGFSTGIYHPETSCRMNISGDAYCSVCRREVDRFLQSLRGNDGPPRCHLRFDGDQGVWEVFGSDFDHFYATLDGEPVPEGAVAHRNVQTLGLLEEGTVSITLRCEDLEGASTTIEATLGDEVLFRVSTDDG